jgi:hypothetical protein
MEPKPEKKMFRYRPAVVTGAVAAVLFIGISLGFIWKSIDRNRIKELDYRIYSEYILHQTEMDPDSFLAALKEKFKENGMTISDEYEVSPTRWEIVGHPGRFWLTSEFIGKITVTKTVAAEKGSEREAQPVLVAYLGSVETGSKEYMFLFFLALGIVLTILVRREALPHIWDGSHNREDMPR